MAAFNKFNSFVEKLAEKVFNLQSDVLKVALTNSAPSSAGSFLTDIVEIGYANLSPRIVTVTASAQTGGLYKLVLADLALTASGTVGPFRYIVLYDDSTPSDDLIGWWDRGSSVTLENGDTFTLDFDGTNGVLQ